VNRAFTSRAVAALGPGIEALCHALIDAFPEREPFDLLPLYAQRVPVATIARLLGVPEADAPDLLRWSHAMVAMYQAGRSRAAEDAAARAASDFAGYLREAIARKRASPACDLLSELIAAREQGDRLSEEELVSTAILLLNAGHEATVHAIGNGVAALLAHGLRAEGNLDRLEGLEMGRHGGGRRLAAEAAVLQDGEDGGVGGRHRHRVVLPPDERSGGAGARVERVGVLDEDVVRGRLREPPHASPRRAPPGARRGRGEGTTARPPRRPSARRRRGR
jgi:hypothetical protein